MECFFKKKINGIVDAEKAAKVLDSYKPKLTWPVIKFRPYPTPPRIALGPSENVKKNTDTRTVNIISSTFSFLGGKNAKRYVNRIDLNAQSHFFQASVSKIALYVERVIQSKNIAINTVSIVFGNEIFLLFINTEIKHMKAVINDQGMSLAKPYILNVGIDKSSHR
jgi:hypothetical protein